MVASQASEGARPTPPDGANNLVIVVLEVSVPVRLRSLSRAFTILRRL